MRQTQEGAGGRGDQPRIRNMAARERTGSGASERQPGRRTRAPAAASAGDGRSNDRNGAGPDGAASNRKSPYWKRRFAAVDLGTNNCRLLVASPGRNNLRIVDSYSRIVRLGEGLSRTGALSDGAIARAIEALRVCAGKISRRGVDHLRCIATQACREAVYGDAFIARARAETGLRFDVISTEEEARLAVRGCSQLIDHDTRAALVFDIGGGSSELSWVDLRDTDALHARRFPPLRPRLTAWTSLPFGVVSLAERHGGHDISAEVYEEMVEEVAVLLRAFPYAEELREIFEAGDAHLLGTSGTVTSIAGVHLGLPRYDRSRVDGLWLTADEARAVCERLRSLSYEERANQPCIGRERADLVVSGCAVLEGIMRVWPTKRLRVADRGLREGVIYNLMDRARGRRRRSRGG